MRKLEALSYKDALTKIGNRFAMNNYVQQINKEQSIGIVYCDITGLKHENDTVGHQMGDQLILRASACLTKAFGDHGVFRIGGDELLAVCSPIDQDMLAERVSRLYIPVMVSFRANCSSSSARRTFFSLATVCLAVVIPNRRIKIRNAILPNTPALFPVL